MSRITHETHFCHYSVTDFEYLVVLVLFASRWSQIIKISLTLCVMPLQSVLFHRPNSVILTSFFSFCRRPTCSVLCCEQLCVPALFRCGCSLPTLVPAPIASPRKCKAFATSMFCFIIRSVCICSVSRPHCHAFVLAGSWDRPHTHSHLKNYSDSWQLG